MDEKTKKIKDFWDERADKWGAVWPATLAERWLRMTEIKTIMKYIQRRKPKSVLDIGCGNGFSTKEYARKFPMIKFFGLDYSEKMIEHAKKEPVDNCHFVVGDVLDPDSFPAGKFDIVTTQRCIQNLPDYESQAMAINNLRAKKSPDGVLLLMECSRDGVAQLNTLRMKLRMKPIENIMPWHNNFLTDQKVIDDFGAKIEYFSSTYMFLAKVLPLHPRLWVIGYLLPPIGKFGYDRLYIIK